MTGTTSFIERERERERGRERSRALFKVNNSIIVGPRPHLLSVFRLLWYGFFEKADVHYSTAAFRVRDESAIGQRLQSTHDIHTHTHTHIPIHTPHTLSNITKCVNLCLSFN